MNFTKIIVSKFTTKVALICLNWQTIQFSVVLLHPHTDWGLRKYAGNQDVKWEDGTICSFGLEPTPELYITHSMQFLKEIHRVLRKDGTLFWNLGDSYCSTAPGTAGDKLNKRGILCGITEECADSRVKFRPETPKGMKPKDLCLIPFRFALAAQEAGWWVRTVIIWSKSNPMPESVKDRPTESHEYIFLLTKSANYYWDQEAVREQSNWNGESGCKNYRPESGWADEGMNANGANSSGRNLRSVWEFPTRGYKKAHFATFPEELPERCIKAGTPEYGCCDKCGKPYERILEISRTYQSGSGKAGHKAVGKIDDPQTCGDLEDDIRSGPCVSSKTIGLKQSCKCTDSKPVPSVVLDPFAGSGTTLWVSKRMGRKSVGYEISTEYCDLIVDRNRQLAMITEDTK